MAGRPPCGSPFPAREGAAAESPPETCARADSRCWRHSALVCTLLASPTLAGSAGARHLMRRLRRPPSGSRSTHGGASVPGRVSNPLLRGVKRRLFLRCRDAEVTPSFVSVFCSFLYRFISFRSDLQELFVCRCLYLSPRCGLPFPFVNGVSLF